MAAHALKATQTFERDTNLERETSVPPAPASGVVPLLRSGPLTGKVVVGRYELGGLLGSGGSAAVYEAKHLWTRRTVAVKVLGTDRNITALRARRAVSEAQLMASLDHPNIVTVFDMDFDDAAGPILVLERLRGRPLASLLRMTGAFSLTDALSALVPIADAVGEAHRSGIVHRDLKPENIFMVDGPRGSFPKLLDFGIAKAFCPEQTLAPSTPSRGLVGTPAYMAPEQIHGRDEISAATDVWALGVMLYECLTGSVPFRATSLPALLSAIVAGAHVPLHRLDPAHFVAGRVDPRVAAVVARAMHPDPRERYSDAGELCRALGGLW
jgi:serine/threonine protein kinase